jgi:carbonic anhydrase
VWIVEHWNSFAKIRQDLWGFVDILGLRGKEIIAVQTTSGSNVSARVKKINEHDNVAAVRAAGIKIEVHGWRENAAGKWVCRRVDLSEEK